MPEATHEELKIQENETATPPEKSNVAKNNNNGKTEHRLEFNSICLLHSEDINPKVSWKTSKNFENYNT